MCNEKKAPPQHELGVVGLPCGRGTCHLIMQVVKNGNNIVSNKQFGGGKKVPVEELRPTPPKGSLTHNIGPIACQVPLTVGNRYATGSRVEEVYISRSPVVL